LKSRGTTILDFWALGEELRGAVFFQLLGFASF
jgi:hypothetical protein